MDEYWIDESKMSVKLNTTVGDQCEVRRACAGCPGTGLVCFWDRVSSDGVSMGEGVLRKGVLDRVSWDRAYWTRCPETGCTGQGVLRQGVLDKVSWDRMFMVQGAHGKGCPGISFLWDRVIVGQGVFWTCCTRTCGVHCTL